ncbi:MAG: flagellar protein FliT [Candidatus Competibacteraceae bacterium]|nr:flagellar protein FliT [Candidatus Competibacteraceae bacterium]
MKAMTDWETAIWQLHSLSMEMLSLAQSSEWQIVTEREEQRRILMDQLFANPPPAEWVSLFQDTIQTVLASDAQVQVLAHAEMDQLSDDIRMLKQRRRAVQAYEDL